MVTGMITEDSLSDRLSILVDELSLAIKWDRPCILFAVYQSEFIKENIQFILRQSLIKQGNDVLNYVVDKAHYDVALDLRDYTGKKQTVFFISGISWGGGKGRTKAYHALNMHREYLVEEKIRTVFWLTKNESRFLPRHAPDFWAFRFNVIEFFDYPSTLNGKSTNTGGLEYRQNIEEILSELHKNPRDINLHKQMASLFSKLGFFEDALAQYYRMLRISPNKLNVWYDIANTYMKMGHPDSKERILKKVSKMAE